MNDDRPDVDGIERLLTGAFDAQARASVPDTAAAPPPRFAEPGRQTVHRRPLRRLAPAIAAAAVVAAAAIGIVVSQTGGDHPVASAASAPAVPAALRAQPNAQPVRVSLLNGDGDIYGVGMPVIAYFSRTITDARALQQRTTVQVNGKPLAAAWYFERSSAGHGPLEAHLRPQSYWPAHAKVHVSIEADDVTAGKGLGFADNLTLDFRTGAATVAVVSSAKHTLTISSDGRTSGPYKVSLGSAADPTLRGTKVIMDRRTPAHVSEPAAKGGGYGLVIKYAQRLTYGGEYLLGAPWNNEVGKSNTSGGSTDMSMASAKAVYSKMRIGDVVRYPDATGKAMQLGAGYGDWNVTWGTWLTGGAVPTH
jgi:lipoprotein-anchoring transpeptidase ErfK/SrfK